LDEIVGSASRPLIWEYGPKLAEARDSAKDEDRGPDANALQLLAAVAMFGLSDDSKEPFTPMMTGNGWRSPIPEDLSDQQFASLEVLLDAAAEPELRARIADVLWNRKRRTPEHGRAAIHAYILSARRLFDPDQWTWAMDRLRRANSISALFGIASPEYESVTNELRATLDRLGGNDSLYFSERLMALLAMRDLPTDEVARYKALSLAMAEAAEKVFDLQRARAYLAASLAWTRALQDQEDFARLRLRIAESYVSEALAQGTEMARTSILRRAIRELREAGAARERIDEIRAMLDDAQELMLSELKPIGIPFDASALAEGARAEARDVSPMQGFWKLAMLVPIPEKSELRERAERSIEQFSFAHGFGRQHLGSAGRLTGTTPGSLGGDADEREELIASLMRDDADRGRLLAVHGLIDPMRQELVRQFQYSLQDIYMAIRGRLLIPRDRELLWTQGLHAGLLGDYSTAVHLLVPQLDNSLRLILQMLKVITYKQYVSGVQDVFKIEDTLGHEKLVEALGEDLVFQFETLLVGRTSSNLRNLLGHGLLNYAQAMSYDSSYCWWLALHLVARVGKPPAELLAPLGRRSC
ncbi:MAG: DUF4209 domain-containing protein, partial [bacterium]|nr:DUF4209 domain-containing protein [bacterium]